MNSSKESSRVLGTVNPKAAFLAKLGGCALILIVCIVSIGLLINRLQQDNFLPTITHTPTLDWRTSPFYVSEKQFGDEWPFTISEGLIECIGQGIVIHLNGNKYALNGYTLSLGYKDIRQSGLWRTTNSSLGEIQVPLSTIVSYAVDKCSR